MLTAPSRPRGYPWIAAGVALYSVALFIPALLPLPGELVVHGTRTTLTLAIVTTLLAIPAVRLLWKGSPWAASTFPIWGCAALAWQVAFIYLEIVPTYQAVYLKLGNIPRDDGTPFAWHPIAESAIVLVLITWYLVRTRRTLVKGSEPDRGTTARRPLLWWFVAGFLGWFGAMAAYVAVDARMAGIWPADYFHFEFIFDLLIGPGMALTELTGLGATADPGWLGTIVLLAFPPAFWAGVVAGAVALYRWWVQVPHQPEATRTE